MGAGLVVMRNWPGTRLAGQGGNRAWVQPVPGTWQRAGRELAWRSGTWRPGGPCYACSRAGLRTQGRLSPAMRYRFVIVLRENGRVMVDWRGVAGRLRRAGLRMGWEL
jgi:hypothetical protein